MRRFSYSSRYSSEGLEISSVISYTTIICSGERKKRKVVREKKAHTYILTNGLKRANKKHFSFSLSLSDFVSCFQNFSTLLAYGNEQTNGIFFSSFYYASIIRIRLLHERNEDREPAKKRKMCFKKRQKRLLERLFLKKLELVAEVEPTVEWGLLLSLMQNK